MARGKFRSFGPMSFGGFVRIDLENLGAFELSATTIQAHLPGLVWALTQPIIHWSQLDHDGGSFGPSRGLQFLMKHLEDCDRKQTRSPVLGSMLEALLMTARGRPSDIGSLNDPSHIVSVMNDLGRLLRPDNCGLSPYIFDELTIFFRKNYHEIAAGDDLLFLIMVAAFCEMTADDMSLLAPFVGLIQQSQDALEILSEYINDVYWSQQFIIPDHFLLALGLQRPLARTSRHGRRNRMSQRFKQFQNPASSPWYQTFAGNSSLWQPQLHPPFTRRHGPVARANLNQGIKGQYLPPGYLQQLVLTHPQAIQVDSRALGQIWPMPLLLGQQGS